MPSHNNPLVISFVPGLGLCRPMSCRSSVTAVLRHGICLFIMILHSSICTPCTPRKSYSNIPPHLEYVATLPCEIWTSENWQRSEICIAINDKWQSSIAKHLTCDGLLHYKYVSQFAGERTFKIGEHLAKLQAKRLTVSCAPFALDVCPQRYKTRQISKITCI